jgi:molybdenum cofactor sulfurtransferase
MAWLSNGKSCLSKYWKASKLNDWKIAKPWNGKHQQIREKTLEVIPDLLPTDYALMLRDERAFREAFPAFGSTAILDRLRETEYCHLDEMNHIYLDYTGGGLYSQSQLRNHFELLRHNVFGNPHSLSPTSLAITKLDERARTAVLNFFHASADEYTVIFTANATHALKLVGEAYPFVPGGHFALLADNHNSVHGIREFARQKGANITYIPVTSTELRGDTTHLSTSLPKRSKDAPGLFAYPAQSNFTGVQHPLEWIKEAQSRGWDVLVDAASFVPTNSLDLSRWHPDFVTISFYKMFGYPTGVGCLLARKATVARLERPWFAGGTVWGVSVQESSYVLLEGNEGFEDGTINYLNLPAVEIGLRHLMAIGMETIHSRVLCLTSWLLQALKSLYHHNGVPVVQIYGPQNCHRRGGTIAFNFLDPHGRIVDERVVERRAFKIHLSLRTGCFCNPGAGEAAFHLSGEYLHRAFRKGSDTLPPSHERDWNAFLKELGMQSGGAIRVSLGLVTNFADVYQMMLFACSFIDDFPTEKDLPVRLHC